MNRKLYIPLLLSLLVSGCDQTTDPGSTDDVLETLSPAEGEFIVLMDTVRYASEDNGDHPPSAEGGKNAQGPFLTALYMSLSDRDDASLVFKLNKLPIVGKMDIADTTFNRTTWLSMFGGQLHFEGESGFFEVTEVDTGLSLVSGKFDIVMRRQVDTQFTVRLRGVFNKVPTASFAYSGSVSVSSVITNGGVSYSLTRHRETNTLEMWASTGGMENGRRFEESWKIYVKDPSVSQRILQGSADGIYHHSSYNPKWGPVEEYSQYAKNDTLNITQYDLARRRISATFTLAGSRITVSDALWVDR